jgi:hypothetical protein
MINKYIHEYLKKELSFFVLLFISDFQYFSPLGGRG